MPRSDSIRAIGLKKHLNDTAMAHNNFGYKDFVRLVRVPEPPSTSSLARIFGVSDLTMKKWLRVWREKER